MTAPPQGSRSSYLAHLAQLAAVDVHPGGHAATDALLYALGLRRGERVLEVGCGTAATLALAVRRYDVDIVGVDVLDEMLSAAQRRLTFMGLGHRVLLARADATMVLPFADASFDAAYAESVLGIQPAREAQSLLAEVFRVLRPGGRFVANDAVWNTGTPPEVVKVISERVMNDFGLYMASPQGWTVEDWRTRMAEAGFRIVSSQLLADLAGSRSATETSWRSRVMTRMYARRWLVDPGLMRRHLRYRRLLRQHADDGRFIEGRLFVLRKPSDGSARRVARLG